MPVNAATLTFAFSARKGAGMTYAAGKSSEILLEAGVQVVVLDTVGNWYGLRLAADGKGNGFDVPMFGGYVEPYRSRRKPANSLRASPSTRGAALFSI
jgi:DNA helicase HerA-like ATPase